MTDANENTDAESPDAAPARQPGFWAIVKEDWVHNGSDWTRPGFRALFVHRFGNWRMKIRSKVIRFPFSILYRWMYIYIRNHYGIEMYYPSKIGRRVKIAHQGCIGISERSSIGDGSVIRYGVTLGYASFSTRGESPHLGKGVRVGAGAKILGGITIGDHARLGANTVVTEDVPARGVVLLEGTKIYSREQWKAKKAAEAAGDTNETAAE